MSETWSTFNNTQVYPAVGFPVNLRANSSPTSTDKDTSYFLPLLLAISKTYAPSYVSQLMNINKNKKRIFDILWTEYIN